MKSDQYPRATSVHHPHVHGNLRSRAAQKPEMAAKEDVSGKEEIGAVNENVWGEMADEAAKVNAAWLDAEPQNEKNGDADAVVDSVEPPTPQLRRARSTRNTSKKVKDKNTGIKGRDASGKKHPPAQRKRAASR